MNDPNKSPLPNKIPAQAVGQGESPSVGIIKVFDFPTAIKHIIEEKKISKKEWKNKDIYGFLLSEKLTLHKEGKDFHWIVSLADLTGTDWFII